MALEFLEDVIAYMLEISFPATYECKLYGLFASWFAKKMAVKIWCLR